MDDTQDETDALDAMRDHEREMVLSRVDDMVRRLGEIKERMDVHKAGEYVPVPDVNEENRPDNVYFIMPDILTEFKYIANTKMPMMEFIRRFENWITRLQCLVVLNARLLENKALMAHMDVVYNVCTIIEHATKAYYDDPDNGF